MSNGVKITIAIAVVIILYGFYEKNRRVDLYRYFNANKLIVCDDIIVQKSRGWRIHNNRFFTNGQVIKTIVFCKKYE
ncbi:MAG: hypothetical protein KAQ94_08360 [Arcobacteraceae bacterium]|nr:hypothetical protein [Arcobacteraceae bacterium]